MNSSPGPSVAATKRPQGNHDIFDFAPIVEPRELIHIFAHAARLTLVHSPVRGALARVGVLHERRGMARLRRRRRLSVG
jgi:hypothetical protein